MTLSEISEFDQYCIDNNIPKSEGLKRLNISEYLYYKSRRTQNLSPITSPKVKPNRGMFIPVESQISSSDASLPSAIVPHERESTKSNLTIEISMGGGKEVRISGEITTMVLREILTSLSMPSNRV